jgi:hypothetical protein
MLSILLNLNREQLQHLFNVPKLDHKQVILIFFLSFFQELTKQVAGKDSSAIEQQMAGEIRLLPADKRPGPAEKRLLAKTPPQWAVNYRYQDLMITKTVLVVGLSLFYSRAPRRPA